MIKVLIKRRFKKDKEEEVSSLLRKFRGRAMHQPGYISGETLRSLDDPEDYMVVSKWETVDDWQKWLQSKERRELQGKVDSLIGEKTFYEIFEPVSH